MNVSFYHVHLGKICDELESILNIIISHGQKDDLHHVQFIKASEMQDFKINNNNQKIMQEIATASPQATALTRKDFLKQALNGYILLQQYKGKGFLDWILRRDPVEIWAAQRVIDILNGHADVTFVLPGEWVALKTHPLKSIIKNYESELPEEFRTRLTPITSAPKSEEDGGAQAQAREIWRQQIRPRLMQGKSCVSLCG